MRLDEICRADWADVNELTRMLLIRGRKDPRNKQGNDQRIPLFGPGGYDGWSVLAEQAAHLGSAKGHILPYNSRSVGTAYRRGRRELGIEDLHFHDLRHEGTSLLFEAGFAADQVSVFSPGASSGGRSGNGQAGPPCRGKSRTGPVTGL